MIIEASGVCLDWGVLFRGIREGLSVGGVKAGYCNDGVFLECCRVQVGRGGGRLTGVDWGEVLKWTVCGILGWWIGPWLLSGLGVLGVCCGLDIFVCVWF